jgi:hypothetical protein
MTLKMKKPGKTILLLLFCAAACTGPSMARAQGEEVIVSTDKVTCTDTTVKIDASNVKPADLIKELGDKCGIKVVVFGEAFDDKTIGVKFQQLPIRKGIERVLRIANLPNYVLHLDSNPENPRIVELDIMGKKGGERQLTAGTGRPASPAPGLPAGPAPSPTPPPAPPSVGLQDKAPKKPAAADKQPPKPAVPDPKDSSAEKAQEDFMKVMDEMMKAQEAGEEPDPVEVLRIFKEVVPPEIRNQIPPEVLKELEGLQNNPQQIPGLPQPR